LPGWFVATGLGVTVKQPDSRGIPGSFATIFSVVTQFSVCPVGPQNRRMEFLGGTGAKRATFQSLPAVCGRGPYPSHTKSAETSLFPPDPSHSPWKRPVTVAEVTCRAASPKYAP
jgi:hypothetical protein